MPKIWCPILWVHAITTRYFAEHITRVDIVFDRYKGEYEIKAVVRSKRVGKQKSSLLKTACLTPAGMEHLHFLGLR